MVRRRDRSKGPRSASRRALLRGGGTTALLIASGALGGAAAATAEKRSAEPSAPPASSGEARYVPRPGKTDYDFTAARTPLSPDGAQTVPAVTVNGSIPGPEIRVRAGEQLRVLLQNGLGDEPTSIHWHGILLPAGMDGVPDISNASVPPGQMYVYEYPIRQTGTYWYHSHVGFQEQLGMYGAFVIEDPDDAVRAEHDAVVLLGDWLHTPPKDVLEQLRREGGGASAAAAPRATAGMAAQGGMPTKAAMEGKAGAAAAGGMAMKAGGADLSDVKYPSFLLNGRGTGAPWSLVAKPGERIRLRVVNGGASTYFRVALDGHELEVTHADGLAVQPVVVDHLLIGMGETYDVVVKLAKAGSATLHAVAQDGSGQAVGVLHTPDAAAQPNLDMPAFAGRALSYAQLRAPAPTTLPAGPARTFRLPLEGDMKAYVWKIAGQAWPDADPLQIRRGDRVEIELVNQTMMWHPMHLHGHFFRLLQGAGEHAPLKHTVNVAPGETVRIEFTADNPGRWFFHCHNLYHLEAGMAREFVYSM